MSGVLNLPDGLELPTPEEIKKMQDRMEVVVNGLVQFFKTNNIPKEEAAIAMTMLLTELEKDGFKVIKHEIKVPDVNN